MVGRRRGAGLSDISESGLRLVPCFMSLPIETVVTLPEGPIPCRVGRKSGERSGQTVRRMVFVLSGILELAVDDQGLVRNPVSGVPLPAKERKSPRYLTHVQVEALAEQLDGEKATLVRFLAYTGLRWGEVAALRVHDVDLVKHRVTVQRNAVLINVGCTRLGARRQARRAGSASPHSSASCCALSRTGSPTTGSCLATGSSQCPTRTQATGGSWALSNAHERQTRSSPRSRCTISATQPRRSQFLPART